MNTIAITCGDVNGIGPEIAIKAINNRVQKYNENVIFICPQNIFYEACKLVHPQFEFKICKEVPSHFPSHKVIIIDIGVCSLNYGKITKDAGNYSFKAIEKASKLVMIGKADAIVTAPISKEAFALAGIQYPGHTELLADIFNSKKFVMMFVSDKMKAGLVTIHIPIKEVSKSITKRNLKNTINIIGNSLQDDFKISKPKIAVLGLNPHAGENGKIGNEEVNLIGPSLKYDNFIVEGPFVPDAFFGNKIYKNYDATIGMYHDQILIPFKLLNFNSGVNFTAGLPYIRTSPDHGTAFDIAGKGIAKPDSMIEAYKYAIKILVNRKK